MSVTQDYNLTISRDELFVLLCGVDQRVKLAEKFRSVPEADVDYWGREQMKAEAMRQRLRDMIVPPSPQPGSLDSNGFEVIVP